MQTWIASCLRAVRDTPTPQKIKSMAIYHLSVKTISRSSGRSATAAAAYRAGVSITDERTGEHHDYCRKSGVEKTILFLPDNSPQWAIDRAALWNAAEAAEKRKNSTVAREFEIALPSELNADQRVRLACNFAHALVKRHGCAADVAIHAPSKEGDERNYHAHILLTTRRLGANGFTEKTRELDNQKSGEVLRWREYFAELQNTYLRAAGITEHVDHRTLEAQGIDRMPTQHLGPTATAIERRTKQPSRKKLNQLRERREQLENTKEEKKLEQEYKKMEGMVAGLSGELRIVKLIQQQNNVIEKGLKDIWNAFDKYEKEKEIVAERLAKEKEQELKRKAKERQRKNQSQSRRGYSR